MLQFLALRQNMKLSCHLKVKLTWDFTNHHDIPNLSIQCLERLERLERFPSAFGALGVHSADHADGAGLF